MRVLFPFSAENLCVLSFFGVSLTIADLNNQIKAQTAGMILRAAERVDL